MISLRRLPRDEWERELRHYGCEPIKGKTALNTAEWWRLPWGGYPFTVPVEDGYILQGDLERIINMIAATAPDGWLFPPFPPDKAN